MVRLKEVNARQRDGRSIEFQFQNGSIKSRQQKFNNMDLQGFNSKMVRLKEDKMSCPVYGLYVFQFQNGSIKSLLRIYQTDYNIVSIPKWFD